MLTKNTDEEQARFSSWRPVCIGNSADHLGPVHRLPRKHFSHNNYSKKPIKSEDGYTDNIWVALWLRLQGPTEMKSCYSAMRKIDQKRARWDKALLLPLVTELLRELDSPSVRGAGTYLPGEW